MTTFSEAMEAGLTVEQLDVNCERRRREHAERGRDAAWGRGLATGVGACLALAGVLQLAAAIAG